jgi:hypothetical protein
MRKTKKYHVWLQTLRLSTLDSKLQNRHLRSFAGPFQITPSAWKPAIFGAIPFSGFALFCASLVAERINRPHNFEGLGEKFGSLPGEPLNQLLGSN